MLRQPYVAGQFYPGSKAELLKNLGGLVEKDLVVLPALGIVSPHAGYEYSGKVAGEVFSKIKIPETVIIVGPNHTGRGLSFSVTSRGEWLTPLGKVPIDSDLAEKLLKISRFLKEDDLAHRCEHSIEVQLPFLQFLRKEFSFVPIVVASAELSTHQAIGREVAKAVRSSKKDVMIIASSDMTHYEPQSEAAYKDSLAIEAILKLDEKLLLEHIEKYHITMCGYAPCIIMLSAVKELGAKEAELVKYQTSGDARGDYDSVVGYAGIIIR
ncbi:MAG: AmmeMemoRadiSam system protein B [Candidatus Omnitrophica bacterium]|nr:AmmeMemoRadiSam system protein B [Candidatus Omnitrophota bacterium]